MGEVRFARLKTIDKPCVLSFALLGVLSIALIGYAVKSGTPLRYLDEQHYVGIAQSLREGKGFVIPDCPRPEPWCGRPTAYRPPAWPIALAAALFLGIPASMLAVVSAVAMIGAAVMISLAGLRLGGSWGALAGVAVLLYPVNAYTSVLLYPQAFATFLVATLAYLAIIASDRLSTSRQLSPSIPLLAGLSAAVLALSVPTLAPTGVAILLWIGWMGRKQRACILLGLAAFIAPMFVWALRNFLVLGSPVLLSTTTGVNLLVGNNANATATSGLAADISGAMDRSNSMSEIEQDKYLRSEATDWIIGHPGDALTLYAAKVVNYFSPYNQPYTPSAGTDFQEWIAYGSFGLLIALVVLRIVAARSHPLQSTEKLFVIIWFANALVMAVFFTRTRFRQPLDALLLLEAGVVCAFLLTHLVQRRRTRHVE